MKICFKCGEEKALSDFYIHKKMLDGHLNKCKTCTKKDVRSNYEGNMVDPNYIKKERKRGRDKYRRLYTGTGKADKKSAERYFEKFPEKEKAKNSCALIKSIVIGEEKHHWSYNEEHYKDVIFINKKHHMKAHRFIVYDQERMMYRRFDNNILLDTKEKHLEFITYCIENEED